MARIEQLPPDLDLKLIAGRPFAMDVTCTGATITSPVVTMKTAAGDDYTTDPGQPSASVAAGVITVAWSAADTSALNAATRAKSYRWSLSATVDGDGPFELLAGTLTAYPVGTSGQSSASAATLTFTAGVTAVDLAVTLGGSGGGGASTLDDLTDVTITAAASGDILRHNGAAWVDTPGTTHFEAAGAVAAHEADTTSVHGIADTSLLETTTGAQAKVDTHVNDTSAAHAASAISFSATGSIASTDVQAAVAEVATDAASALSSHEADTTNVHGIADTSTLVTTSSAPELIRDTIGTALVAGSGITITVNDPSDTITIAASGAAGPTLVMKTANENVASSTTLQDDDHLFFSVDANSTYVFRGVFWITAALAADVKFAATAPSGATLLFAVSGNGVARNDGLVQMGATQTSGAAIATGANTTANIMQGWFEGTVTTSSTAGTLQIQWAQNTSDVNNATVYAGSWIEYRKA